MSNATPKKPKSTKTTPDARKINLMLLNGLYLISGKNREGTSLYTLYITDFTENTRIVLDAENGKVLPNKHGVELKAQDVETIVKAVGYVKKPVDAVVIEAAAKKLEEAKETMKKVSFEEKLASLPSVVVDIKYEAGY